MNRHIHSYLLLLALGLAAIGCSGNGNSDVSRVRILIGAGSAALPVHSITFTITGPGMLKLQETVNNISAGDSISKSLTVPNGKDRSFLVEVKDAEGDVLYRGNKSGVTLDGTPLSLDIELLLTTWQHGTSANDESYGIATDSSGNIYVVGTAYDVAEISSRVVLSKFDQFGVLAWQRSFGPSGTFNQGRGLAVDGADGVLVTGVTGSEIGAETSLGGVDSFVAKYDSAGNQEWIRQFGSAGDDLSTAIAVDAAGNAYVTGYTDGDIDDRINAGGYDAFIVKYDSTGNRVTSETRLTGTSADDYSEGIAADGSGSIIIAGSTEGVFAGQSNAGLLDLFLAKYDTSGNEPVWIKQRGTIDDDQVWGMAMDALGNVYVAGWTFSGIDGNTNQDSSGSTADVFLMKFDNMGNRAWTDQIGTADNDVANSVAIDKSGNIYLTGGTRGGLDGNASSGGYDLFVTKYGSDGAKQWTRQRGTGADEEGMAVTVEGSGNILLAGYTGGDLDKNINYDASGQTADFFVMRFDPDGGKR